MRWTIVARQLERNAQENAIPAPAGPNAIALGDVPPHALQACTRAV